MRRRSIDLVRVKPLKRTVGADADIVLKVSVLWCIVWNVRVSRTAHELIRAHL